MVRFNLLSVNRSRTRLVLQHYLLSISYAAAVCTALFFFFSSRRRHTRFHCDWSSDVCSSDLTHGGRAGPAVEPRHSFPHPHRDAFLVDYYRQKGVTMRMGEGMTGLARRAGASLVRTTTGGELAARSEARRVGKHARPTSPCTA